MNVDKSGRGFKTGLYLAYDNQQYLETIKARHRFASNSSAINFIMREMRKLEETGQLEIEEVEPYQTEDGEVDIYEWLTK